MKYVVVIADGMADYPVEDLKGKTPLEFLSKPVIDALAKESLCGMVKTVPENMSPGSDVANLSIFGYDPKRFFSGRAPLEAASRGIEMELNDVAFRCNLVTLSDKEGKFVMDDYSAGHISTEEAGLYIDFLNEKIVRKGINFYKGVSYRHLMLWREGKYDLRLTPPHDIPDEEIEKYLPEGDGADFIRELMEESQKVLRDCPLNLKRRREHKKEVSSIWLWGQGKKPSMPTFAEKFNIRGAVISAVDLIFGIGILAGLKPIRVEGATGYIDTNFEGKAIAAAEALYDNDICFVHIEACDEASHEGSLEKKMEGIKAIDQRFLKTLISKLKPFDQYRILFSIDHPTPVKQKVHVADAVPFFIFDNGKKYRGVPNFSENACRGANFYIEEGFKLIEILLNGEVK